MSLGVNVIYGLFCFRFIDGVICMNKTIMLKVSKKGDKGSQVCSVPLRKLKLVASDNQRHTWQLQGDFLVLNSY
jgi:hypothetical protein